MLKRILPVILTVSFLVCCLVVPASAASVDYIDYVVDVFETDGVEMCRVEIPVSAFGPGVWYIQNRGNGQMLKSFSGHSFTYNFSSGINYNLLYRPMQGGNRILTYDIPDGTVFSVNAYVKTASSDGYSGGNFTWYLQYYNSSSNVISSLSSSGTNGLDNSSAYGIFTLLKPDHTESIGLYSDFYNFSVLAGGYDWEIGVKSIVMTMTISSLYLQFIQNGRNNQIMDSVEKALADQGMTLDSVLDAQQQTNEQLGDIMNDKVDPEIPVGSDKVDDYNQAESELIDSVQGGSNEFDDVSINAWDRIFTYSQSFMAFGLIFKLFADIPIIQSLLYVSLTLGAFAFMLNLASSLGSFLGRSTRQRQAAVRYRVSIENRRRRHG